HAAVLQEAQSRIGSRIPRLEPYYVEAMGSCVNIRALADPSKALSLLQSLEENAGVSNRVAVASKYYNAGVGLYAVNRYAEANGFFRNCCRVLQDCFLASASFVEGFAEKHAIFALCLEKSNEPDAILQALEASLW